jgi:hypothetical protein
VPDYLAKARALRAKAADPAVPAAERRALLDKATELESKYRNPSSSFTFDTIITGRDGIPPWSSGPAWDAWAEAIRNARKTQAEKIAEDLRNNQWRWNSEYYDRFGNPKPYVDPDLDDVYEEDYRYDPEEDEDEGYDEAYGEEPL